MASTETNSTYVRKGFGLKSEVQDALAADYDGRLVDLLRASEYTLTVGDVTIRLAREFGFCYGVERAVDYAYQTRKKFPDKRICLAGEIIHNPHVNHKLREMGIEFLGASERGFDYSTVRPEDVVILPAFGVTIHDFETLRALGCVVVDTTCGSVLNVWKRVEVYARDGFTSLIHGKNYHEETRATASQARKYPGAHWIVVRNMDEARLVCEYIEGSAREPIGSPGHLKRRRAFFEKFECCTSPGFDPDRDLARIGVANQTTMLARESLAIGEEVGRAMARAYGEEYRATHFRTFDTICSATQDRQDAVDELLREQLDVMLVVGGFNSSNTMSLAAICADKVPTYHVEDAEGIDPERGTVRYRPIGVHTELAERAGWLPAEGPVVVGITAGASTPNNKIGDAIARVFRTRGIDAAEALGLRAWDAAGQAPAA
jgi:4-hydroxy-3-methylbut-2-enyl diphosphate reductase